MLYPTSFYQPGQEMRSRSDHDLQQMIPWLETSTCLDRLPNDVSGRLSSLRVQRRYLVLIDGVLLRRWEDVPGGGVCKHLQLVLPGNLVKSVLEGLRSTLVGGHMGAAKTLAKVRARFYWPEMSRCGARAVPHVIHRRHHWGGPEPLWRLV